MPRFDGTGPKGEGALSGRRLGQCEHATDFQGKGYGQQHRRNRRGLCGNSQSVEPRENRNLTSGMDCLRTQIEAFQACLNRLKVQIDK